MLQKQNNEHCVQKRLCTLSGIDLIKASNFDFQLQILMADNPISYISVSCFK